MTLDAVIVMGAGAFALVFVAAWLGTPDLRAWLEAPKHGFQASVRSYDRVCHAQDRPTRNTTS